ncbi:hypothetical protein M406DRAFT_18307, partial [Cryphonectria parasitica EP155]
VAIVTGGSSGIGLALTNHLIAKKWHVFIVDLQQPVLPVLPDLTTFLSADVSDWDQLAAAFEKAHARFSRLDFCALNAGIDDRDDIFRSISSGDLPPRRPNMRTFEVNLFGPYYGLKLAAHYMSRNPEPVAQGGKVVVTASVSGFRAHPLLPQYSSTKYGVLGLVRALAPAAKEVNIRINCLCPAVTATGLPPPGLMEKLPESIITPMSTLLRGFDELAEFDRLATEGRAKWVSQGQSGASVEGNLEELYYREE